MKSNRLIIKMSKIIVVLTALLFTSKFIDNLAIQKGRRYLNHPDFGNCINNIKISNSKNIILGTSVTRELRDASQEYIKINGKDYFICGISTVTTNLQFHLFIIDLLSQRHDLSRKNILIEITNRSIIDNEALLSGWDFLMHAPLNSYLSVLKHYKTGYFSTGLLDFRLQGRSRLGFIKDYINIVLNVTKSLLYPIFLPAYRLASVGAELGDYKRVNVHQDKVFNIKNNPEQLYGLMPHESIEKTLLRWDYLLNKLNKKSDSIGFKYKVVLLPVNQKCLDFTKFPSDLKPRKILDSLNFPSDKIIDISKDNRSSYFADCVHFNRYGQSKFEIK